MSAFKSEIDWFHNNHLKPFEHEKVCQCGTEKLIRRSSEPERMRAFLLVSVFIDQLIYTHFPSVYSDFSQEHAIPKLAAHSFCRHASPSWFIYSKHGYDELASWEKITAFAASAIEDIRAWLDSRGCMGYVHINEAVAMEIKCEFEPAHWDNLSRAFGVRCAQ